MYRFIDMIFGHIHAPRFWTKVMKCVVKFLRSLGIRCVVYIDDLLLIRGPDPEVARKELHFVFHLLLDLGLTINMGKSVLVPTTRILYLGFIIDSKLMKLFLPRDKVKNIVKTSKKLSKKGVTTVRNLASFLGLISAAAEAVLPWRLRTRALLLSKNNVLKQIGSWDAPVELSKDCLDELNFWTTEFTCTMEKT